MRSSLLHQITTGTQEVASQEGEANSLLFFSADTPDWLLGAVILMGALLVALVLQSLAKLVVEKLADSPNIQRALKRLCVATSLLTVFSAIHAVWRLELLAFLPALPEAAQTAMGFVNYFLVWFTIIWPLQVLLFDYYFLERKGLRIPRLVRDVIVWIVYLLVIAQSYVVVSKKGVSDLAPLLTTSAVLSFVLGFAMQDTLANLFAGLSIHFEGSFALGDYILAGGQEGQVAGITWRSIKIRTFEDDYMIMPNSMIAKGEIINYSQPTPITARIMKIGVSYSVPPGKVERVIMEVLGKVDGVLRHPAPRVRLVEYGDFSINYNIRFWINNYSRYHTICHDVFYLIWYHFKREDIEIPFPIRNVYMREAERADSPAAIGRRAHTLERVDFLGQLDEEHRRELAAQVEEVIFADGETIIAQDQRNAVFYLIQSGEVVVERTGEQGGSNRLGTLAPGDYFGEHSLLTGEVASASVKAKGDTVLGAIDKAVFQKLLDEHPEMAEQISRTLAEREQKREKELDTPPVQGPEMPGSGSGESAEAHKKSARANLLLERMRRMFRIGNG